MFSDGSPGVHRPTPKIGSVKKTVIAAVATALTAGLTTGVAAPAGAHGTEYRTRAGHALTGTLRGSQIVGHTDTAHGTLSLNDDGSFRYAPDAGFTGTDSFTVTRSDAVRLYGTELPPLATIGGVAVGDSAYGSAVAPVPGHPDEYYGLTDRGPNVDGPNDTKVEPLPDYAPKLGKFRLHNGKATLLGTITLRGADGTPYNGRVNSDASTGETITDLNGTVLAPSKYGYDPEGLVARSDGTFWISDEYGPFITHFDAKGRQLGRLSPYDGSLPAELAYRTPNKGMEGLTITPDGRTLVGIMQSALTQPDLTVKTKNVALTRIVTYDLRTHATHEYAYLLDNPGDTGTAVSEITAVSDTRFLVDERDGEVEPGAYKKLFSIDVSHATDIEGVTVGGKSLEALVGKESTDDATATLAAAGITPVSKSLSLDLGGLLTRLNPDGYFFGHDKIEGVALADHGRTLIISNDSDFGIDGLSNDTAPYQLHAKTLPDGSVDSGEYLAVDLAAADDATTSTTVTITVTH